MEEKKSKIIFNKSGDGYFSGKLSIPLKWLKDMNVTLEEREVEVKYNEKTKTITIKKAK